MAKGPQEIARRSRAAAGDGTIHSLIPFYPLVRITIICLALLGVAGCSQLGESEQAVDREQLWRQTQQSLQAYDQWDLRARAAVSLPGEVYNIGLQWRRQTDGLLLLIEAPFGQGVIRIETAGAGMYRLLLPDGRVYLNQSPEALLEDVIGWSIPVSGLDYWIRGMPHPDAAHSRIIDSNGQAREIRQDSWSIEYQDYFPAAQRPPLPRRLRLAHDDLRLRLVIDHWQVEPVEDDQSELFPEFN